MRRINLDGTRLLWILYGLGIIYVDDFAAGIFVWYRPWSDLSLYDCIVFTNIPHREPGNRNGSIAHGL